MRSRVQAPDAARPYNDAAAGKLLDDVEIKRVANPNSPDWEIYLLDEISKRTKMLETSEFVQLQNLQKLRHLSAHPVLTAADLLFRPTKEDTRAQIRMALEAVLLKPALFSKRVIDTLVEDIAANKALLISREKLKTYLEARYLPNMPSAIERELFRVLWKFCFRLNNADTEANRAINADTLAILFSRDPAAVRAMIGAERPVFSNVGPDAEPLDALVAFLADHGDLFGLLDPAAQIQVDGRLAADINNRARGRFKSPDMAAHLAALLAEEHDELGKLDDHVWRRLLADASGEGEADGAVRLASRPIREAVATTRQTRVSVASSSRLCPISRL